MLTLMLILEVLLIFKVPCHVVEHHRLLVEKLL